jgi:hypothetical protein
MICSGEVYLIFALIANRPDAQIFVDAYYWSKKDGHSVFATTGVNDFVIHRAANFRDTCRFHQNLGLGPSGPATLRAQKIIIKQKTAYPLTKLPNDAVNSSTA